jgi:hypothetical protein
MSLTGGRSNLPNVEKTAIGLVDRGSAAMASPMGCPKNSIISSFPDSSFPDPAARLVRKGSNFESVLCGLSPPVVEGGPLAHWYTFCSCRSPTRVTHQAGSTRFPH